MILDGKSHSPSARAQQLLLVTALAVISSLLAEDWIAGVAVWMLWAVWHYLPAEEGPPVLAFALSFQWVQIVSGIFYYGLTSRRVEAMDFDNYRLMVLIGLGCLVALLSGLLAGIRLLRGKHLSVEQFPQVALTWSELLLLYAGFLALTGIVQEFAWQIPQLTQSILALNLGRFAVLFLLLRRLIRPQLRWKWVMAILTGEVMLGCTGYFAGFREALMIAVLALLEGFDRRQARQWLVLVVLAGVILVSGVVWTSIKVDYRQEFENPAFAASRLTRLESVASLSSSWLLQSPEEILLGVDLLVERLWAVYYPALALDRVPSVLPHENGALMWKAVWHILTPRLLFPEKGVLDSDSEMVRMYTGMQVAGPEEGTSIAFGYAAESYVDFGVPWMFLPVFIYGLLMGMAYRWLLWTIKHRELAVALVTTVYWVSLYLFERSWLKTLGASGTLIICLGGMFILLDRALLHRSSRAMRRSYSTGSVVKV